MTNISLKSLLEAEQPSVGDKPTSQPAVGTTKPSAPAPTAAAKQPSAQSQSGGDFYNMKTDFSEFEDKISRSTEQTKNEFQSKILSKIQNKKVQTRASKGYGQPEKDFVINVSSVSIDFYYEKYVVVIKGREENKQKETEFFVKPPYSIKILGSASVSRTKKKATQPVPVVPPAKTNVATQGV